MKPEKFPILELAFKGELVSNNVDAFGLAVHSWLDSLPSAPTTDDEFAAAEEAVKTIKQAEDEIRETVDAIYPDDIQTLRECLGGLLDTMATKRLALDKAVRSAKEAKKTAMIDGALEAVPHIDQSFQRDHYRAVLIESIKGKRTSQSVEKELATRGKIIAEAIRRSSEMLDQFTEQYGVASLPDRPQLLIKNPEILESELRRRADLIDAQKREAELKAKIEEQKPKEDVKPEPAPSPEPAQQPELIPEKAPADESVNHLAEWREFAEVIKNCAGQMREARSRLRDPRNIESAEKFAAALTVAWKEVA